MESQKPHRPAEKGRGARPVGATASTEKRPAGQDGPTRGKPAINSHAERKVPAWLRVAGKLTVSRDLECSLQAGRLRFRG